MIKISLDQTVSGKTLRMIQSAPDRLSKAVDISLFRAGNQLKSDGVTMAPYLSGHLRRSITMQKGAMDVKVGTNLVYAQIHDKGGIIRPKKKKYLRFKINGRWVMAKKVRIPKYKGRGYLTPAFKKLVDGRAKEIFEFEILKQLSQ